MPELETDPLLPKRTSSSEDTPTSSSCTYDHNQQQSAIRNAIIPTSRHDTSNDQASGVERTEDSAPLQPSDFYELIGMKVPVTQGKAPNNLEAAHGFYSQVCAQKRFIERKYRLYDIVIMFLLITQIFLSAVFIILGALNVDQHITIAVLGAVSSVIAGVLALMRGQGLPNRLRMQRDGLKRVILAADELYWDVGAGREVRYQDVRALREAYEGVLEDARRNHPDTWNSSTLPIAQGLAGAGTSGKRPVAPGGRS